MPTSTTRLGLLKPSTADPFVTADLAGNWQKVDDHPGYRVCTSTTRPAWGAAQQGMLIVETDTGLVWRWTGSAFERIGPRGLLKTSGGAWARGQRTTNFSTTNYTTPQVVVSIDNVVVPAGLRTLMIAATWGQAASSGGVLGMYLYRSNVSGQAPNLAGWWQAGDSTSPSPGANGQGGSFITYEPGGLAAGTYNWSLQIMCHPTYRGTSTISASATTPAEIAVIEI